MVSNIKDKITPLAITSLPFFNKIKKTIIFKIAPSVTTFPRIPCCFKSSTSLKVS